MKQQCYGNIQRQVNSLITIIEFCISLARETELTQNKLNILPGEIEELRKQVEYLNSIPTQKQSSALKERLQEVEFKIDSLVDDLDNILVDLFTFDGKLKNVIALREKLEAIQEERIDGITPERIYELLAKEQRRLQERECISSSQSPKNSFIGSLTNNIWQKVKGWSYNLREPKTAISLAIIVSLSFGWMVGYHSSTNLKLNDNQTVDANKKLNNSSVDI